MLAFVRGLPIDSMLALKRLDSLTADGPSERSERILWTLQVDLNAHDAQVLSHTERTKSVASILPFCPKPTTSCELQADHTELTTRGSELQVKPH